MSVKWQERDLLRRVDTGAQRSDNLTSLCSRIVPLSRLTACQWCLQRLEQPTALANISDWKMAHHSVEVLLTVDPATSPDNI